MNKEKFSNKQNKKNTSLVSAIISELFLLFAISVLFGLRWAKLNYPMHLNWNVFFVLSSDVSGHDSGTFLSAFKGFIIPTIIVYVLCNFVFFLFRKKNPVVSKFIIKKSLIFTALFAAFSVSCAFVSLKVWKYPIIAYKVNSKPVKSDFYEENYVDPNSVSIAAPEKKRNIIIIYLESMESSFMEIEKGGIFEKIPVPHLQELAQNNINFSDTEKIGGAEEITGTGWTAAALLSKVSALPYFNPFKISDDGKTIECLSKAVFISDILFEQGYNCVLSIGSEKQFENRDAIFETHHTQVHDIDWYKENGLIPSDYQVFWGFEDDKLYDMVRYELSNLSQKDEPFFFQFLTSDTHFPSGFKCSQCPDEFNNQMMNVLKCADNLLYNFLEWAKTQSWYENTTILITGDHKYMNGTDNNFINDVSPLSLKEIDKKRKVLDIIINSVPNIDKSKQKNRLFSSLDIMPTLLEASGFKIEGGALALGRSLFSENKTLVEKYGVSQLEDELMTRTIQYDELR